MQPDCGFLSGYTRFDMVLVCDQVMCKRGAKSTTEAMGLGFGQRNVGRLFLGRGDPIWWSTLGLVVIQSGDV